MRIERVGVSLLTFALAAVLTGHAIGASDDGKEKEEETPTTFSPEVEKKMAEFFDKATEAKRDFWEVRMRNEIEGLEKAAQLGAEERKSLDAAAVKAI